MSQTLDRLKRRRGKVVKTVLRANEFIEQNSEESINEYIARLESLTKQLGEFSAIQDEIEDSIQGNELNGEEQERDTFEKMYYKTVAQYAQN